MSVREELVMSIEISDQIESNFFYPPVNLPSLFGTNLRSLFLGGFRLGNRFIVLDLVDRAQTLVDSWRLEAMNRSRKRECASLLRVRDRHA